MHQPEKVMDLAGVEPGMVIGEVGAGYGYFTYKLADRVGDLGLVYANDINPKALSSIQNQCKERGILNIETILGKTEETNLPEGILDMVFMVNALHDLAKPVALLNSLALSLKPGATIVILDRDPEKLGRDTGHFLHKEDVLKKVEESIFQLVRMETFLPEHNIYILSLNDGY